MLLSCSRLGPMVMEDALASLFCTSPTIVGNPALGAERILTTILTSAISACRLVSDLFVVLDQEASPSLHSLGHMPSSAWL